MLREKAAGPSEVAATRSQIAGDVALSGWVSWQHDRAGLR